jgi:tetratricopeptide (TPR) repeat protein
MNKILLLSLLLLPFATRAQNTSYHAQQIAQWLQQGAWDDVINAAQSAADADSFLLQSAGYASYQNGDKTAACNYFNRLLALDSNNRQALYYTGIIAKGDEAYDVAILMLERLVRNVSSVAAYRVLLADCYTSRNMRAEAINQLLLARNLLPSSAAISNKLVNALMRQKSWDSAQQVLDPAIKQHPHDPALISTAINLAYSRKQYAKASAWTDSLLLTRRPRYEALLVGLYADVADRNQEHTILLGNVLMALGQENEEVLYYTANAHKELRHWDAADSLLKKCVGKMIRPNLETYYLDLAEVAGARHELARSMAYYDTAYYLFRSPVTLYRKGLALQMAGRKTEAKQVYKKYLALPAMQDTAISHYLQRMIEQQ